MPAAVAHEIWKWISEGVAMEHIVVWLRPRTVPAAAGNEYKVTMETWFVKNCHTIVCE